MRRPVALFTGVLLALLPAAPAAAHVGTGGVEVTAGTTTTIELSVPHGCAGAATTSLEVLLPEGFAAVVAADAHGFSGEVDDDVARWSGGVLPDGVDGTFPLRVRVPDVSGRAHLPTIQGCGEQELTWIDIGGDGIAEGQPAPSVVVVGGSVVLDDPGAAAGSDAADEAGAGWLDGVAAALLVGGAVAVGLRRRVTRDEPSAAATS